MHCLRFKVLNLIGLAEKVASLSIPIDAMRDLSSNGDMLGFSSLPKYFPKRYGQPAVGVKRTDLNLVLKQALLDRNIELNEGHALEEIEEFEEGVVATFKNGAK